MLTTSLPRHGAAHAQLEHDHVAASPRRWRPERRVAVGHRAHRDLGLLERRHRREAGAGVVVDEQHGLAPARAQRRRRTAGTDIGVSMSPSKPPNGSSDMARRRRRARRQLAQQRQDLLLRARAARGSPRARLDRLAARRRRGRASALGMGATGAAADGGRLGPREGRARPRDVAQRRPWRERRAGSRAPRPRACARARPPASPSGPTRERRRGRGTRVPAAQPGSARRAHERARGVGRRRDPRLAAGTLHGSRPVRLSAAEQRQREVYAVSSGSGATSSVPACRVALSARRMPTELGGGSSRAGSARSHWALKPVASPGLGARLFAPGTPQRRRCCARPGRARSAPTSRGARRSPARGRHPARPRARRALAQGAAPHAAARSWPACARSRAPSAPCGSASSRDRCRSSRRAAAEPTPARTPAPAPASVVGAAAAIADPELRARFLESAARYLDRFPARDRRLAPMRVRGVLRCVKPSSSPPSALPTGKFLGTPEGLHRARSSAPSSCGRRCAAPASSPDAVDEVIMGNVRLRRPGPGARAPGRDPRRAAADGRRRSPSTRSAARA